MNNQERIRKMNEALQFIRPSNRSGSHVNCIRINPNPHHDKHNRAVIERCLEYSYIGVPFITEGILHNGERFDILLPLTSEVEEIMISETDKRLNEKNYPFKIRKIKVRS